MFVGRWRTKSRDDVEDLAGISRELSSYDMILTIISSRGMKGLEIKESQSLTAQPDSLDPVVHRNP